MKRLLCLLAVLCGTATAAMAGPNEGGVLWVHDTGIEFSSDLTLPPVSTPPADCAGVDNQQDADGLQRVWKVYAAFAPESHPRLKTCGWAIQFPEITTSPLSFVKVTGGGIPDEDGPDTDFYIPDLGFPFASGGQIGQSFPSGPRTSTAVTLFYFYGYAYHGSGPLPIWSTAPHSAPGNRVFGDDATPTNEDPIMGYGTLGFGVPGTTPCPVYDPTAACCTPTGGCTITRQADCAAPGIWHAEWYACMPNPCPQPPAGACCFVSGACAIRTAADCADTDGVFYGGACEPSPCPQPGACCYPDGSCSITQETTCVSTGGSFYGGPCTPNPCTQPPPGACCFASGACSMRTEAACASYGGVFYDGPCEPNPCPQPGACCFTDGSCLLEQQTTCGSSGGSFYGGACTPNPCPQPPTGACCLASGACSILTQAACASAGGVFHDGACEPNPCPQPGACCFASGFCSTLQQVACESAGGSYYGGPCIPTPCPQPPPEACCFTGGACSLLTPVACASAGGLFHGGACEPNPCSVPVPTAACCAPTGTCSVTTQSGCHAPSIWHADWPVCTPNPCPQAPPSGPGDTFATAVLIPELPFSGSGTTVGYVNDYDAVCPYSGATAPDVVYSLMPTTTQAVNIDLCYSSYDTKVYVYDSLDLVNPIACNDDYYFAAPCFTYSSFLGEVCVTAGHAYYIVIDGYGSSAGAYQLDVTSVGACPISGACCAPTGACTMTTQSACTGVWQGENSDCVPNPCPIPPPVGCPSGALLEGEPLCQDNYSDNYNGGCNSTPVIWQTLTPQAGGCAVMCGKSCTYLYGGASNRDTDWFLSVGGGGTITYAMTADFPFMQALFTGVDCAGLVYTYNIGNAGESWTLTADVASAVEVGFFAANSGFSGYPLEGTYVLSICGIADPPPPPGACCSASGVCILTTPELCAFGGGTFIGGPCVPSPCATPTERTSWGAIKARFRDLDPRAEEAARRWKAHEHASPTPNPTITANPVNPVNPAITTRPSGGSVPDLLGATRPRKPGSTGMRGDR